MTTAAAVAEGLRAERLRRERLLDQSLSAAFSVALDFDACAALLNGRPVPRHRLDSALADALGIPGGGSLVLDLAAVERIMLAGPSPSVGYVCARCGRREERAKRFA